MAYEFLSDEWLAEVQRVREELGDDSAAPAVDINVVVTGAPSGDREVHLSNGVLSAGLIDGAPTKLTVPFEVARALFVEQNQQAAMQAFMAGQIRIEGDMANVMAVQASANTPAQQQLQDKLRDLTEV